MAERKTVGQDTKGWDVRDRELSRYYTTPGGEVYREMRQNTTIPGKPDVVLVFTGRWGTAPREVWLKQLGPRQAADFYKAGEGNTSARKGRRGTK